MSRVRSDLWHLAAGLGGVALVTLFFTRWLPISNAAIVATSFLLVVLLVAATSRLAVAIATSIGAMLSLNFFFLPPVGTFTIADPQNWVALFAFLTVSLVASNLSAVARARTREAVGRRDELARLFDLSRDILSMSDSREAMTTLARAVARRFDLEFVAIALPTGGTWDVVEAGGRRVTLEPRQLSDAFAKAQSSYEFDAYARTYAGHEELEIDGRRVRLVPLRVGTRPVGLLAATGRPIEPGTLDTLAGVVAIAIERAQFLEERKASDLTRQSEALKSALLASLAHDLRTPLTTIRVAAANLRTGPLSDDARIEQSDLILAEAERLTRLFENILAMAGIDAGAVPAEPRWTHPSEIIEAARAQVEHTIRQHRVEVSVDQDVPVRLDPRLTATATAYLLENAAKYAPAGSVIEIRARVHAAGLDLAVRDHGPGIAAADLPHLFERFYRGASGKPGVSGTGMGLAIARGLLAVEQGRVWAENCSDGGAMFTIAVPAATKVSPVALSPAT